MVWLRKNAALIEAGSALVMAFAAIAAAILVPMQIAANDRTSREQAAREIYREFLNITIQRPELAEPTACTPADPGRNSAYEAYVDYLLYTAEQVLELSAEEWRETVSARLAPHQPYLCGFDDADLATLTAPVAELVRSVQTGCTTTLALCP
ncbi:hypothetical protein HKCCSP123_07685 [Rhodobacterales bacterium HKCCSP123]|nr:hypothetical protein [Rhodobacterales bacterium HKCCSP123]